MKVEAVMTLIKPYRPKYDANLIARVETRRLSCATFSNAHWIMQLIVEYHSLFTRNQDGKQLTPWGAQGAAAIIDVFETLLSKGDKAAIKRAQALKDDGFPILTWFPFPGNEMSVPKWKALGKRILKDGQYHYRHEGD